MMNQIIPRIASLAGWLLEKRVDDLDPMEQEVFHLCFELGLLYADFGEGGTEPGVVKNGIRMKNWKR